MGKKAESPEQLSSRPPCARFWGFTPFWCARKWKAKRQKPRYHPQKTSTFLGAVKVELRQNRAPRPPQLSTGSGWGGPRPRPGPEPGAPLGSQARLHPGPRTRTRGAGLRSTAAWRAGAEQRSWGSRQRSPQPPPAPGPRPSPAARPLPAPRPLHRLPSPGPPPLPARRSGSPRPAPTPPACGPPCPPARPAAAGGGSPRGGGRQQRSGARGALRIPGALRALSCPRPSARRARHDTTPEAGAQAAPARPSSSAAAAAPGGAPRHGGGGRRLRGPWHAPRLRPGRACAVDWAGRALGGGGAERVGRRGGAAAPSAWGGRGVRFGRLLLGRYVQAGMHSWHCFKA